MRRLGDNTAYVTGGGDPACAGATDCPGGVSVSINALALAITKSASPNPFIVGQAASYTITVTNNGTADTTATSTISDAIPTDLTIGTLPAGCSAAGQNVTCTIAAGRCQRRVTGLHHPGDANGQCDDWRQHGLRDGGGDPACAGATDCPGGVSVNMNAPALAITKSASPNPFVVGQAASYTITVTNTGTADTTATSTISDAIPTGLTIGTLPQAAVPPARTSRARSQPIGAGGGSQAFTNPVTPTSVRRIGRQDGRREWRR